MEPTVHWSIWLLAGMALGLLSGIGESAIFGLLVGAGALLSPFVIYTYAGVAYLPFFLFYGGLIAVTTVMFKRKEAKRDAKLRAGIDERNKRFR